VRSSGIPHNANDNGKVTAVVVLLDAGLLLSRAFRFYNLRSDNPQPLTGYATIIYVCITVFAVIRLSRIGVPIRRVGFGLAFQPAKFLALAAIGVGLIQLFGVLLDPLTEWAFGEARNLDRFSDVAGSPTALVQLLALNWTVAAFGEELAFRIVLMRGIAYALGDSRAAFVIALILQAVLFGAIHAYQGPAGIIGTGINGLVFGGLTLAARGSIWPAALAHGSSNTIGILTLYLGG
jgi:membrane protease YdiL (CAAX protease family)